jgi:hypothetical protein
VKADLMTFQNTSESFSSRGPVSASAPFIFARRVGSAIASVANAVFDSFVKAAETSSRAKQIEALHAKSDAELAKMGIKRENIAHHVFNDLYYT